MNLTKRSPDIVSNQFHTKHVKDPINLRKKCNSKIIHNDCYVDDDDDVGKHSERRGNNIIHQTSLKVTKKLLLEILNQLVCTRNSTMVTSKIQIQKNDQLFFVCLKESFC